MTDGKANFESIVFVVDDDPQACRAVAELVQSFGYHVRLFESSEDFLEYVDDSRPGCVILDLRISGVDGMEVHQRLLEPTITLPVVVLTGYAETTTTVRSPRNGAVTVLDKPFRDDELWSFVQ